MYTRKKKKSLTPPSPLGGLGAYPQNGYLPPKISHIRWVKPNGPTNSLITQKVVEQFSKSGHFWKIEIKTHRKKPPPPSPPPLRGLLDSVQNACFFILSVDIWTLSSCPLNGVGGWFFYLMFFNLNFSKMSTFWKLLHNFLSYKVNFSSFVTYGTQLANFHELQKGILLLLITIGENDFFWGGR